MVGLCRLCASLRKKDVLTTIKDESSEICEKIRKCCQIDIKMQDGLPKSICQECVENLNNSYKFYNKVKEAQETLETLYPTPEVHGDKQKQITETQPSLLETLSVAKENFKKRKQSAVEEEIVKLARIDENQTEDNRQMAKENKLETSQVKENDAKKSKEVQETYIQEVYEMLKMTKEEIILEDSYEIFETIEGNNTEELNEDKEKNEYFSYQEVENHNEVQEEDVILVENGDKNCLEMFNVNEDADGKVTNKEGNLNLQYKGINNELEYVDIYEEIDEDDEEEMEEEESINTIKQTKANSLLHPQIKLKSWKNYVYLCFVCDQALPSFITLKNHFAENHKITQIDNFKYKCYDCQKTIPRYNFFLNHIRSKHHPDLKLQCEVCDLSCKNFEELSQHRSFNCAKASDYVNIIACNQCFKSFHNVNGLQNHQKFQHVDANNKVKYKCHECNKEFQYRSCLKVHAQVHTDRETFSCSFCGKLFHSKISLDQHIFSHIDDNTYKCNICNKSFKTFQCLDNHQIIHTDNKKFQCDFCEKTFRKKIQKITHERTHTGEMPFSCDQCDKRFRFRSALLAHVKSHTGVKPYSCEYCDKTFADSSNRNKHMRRKHANHV
ncbi:uncharacterized protein ACRADG_013268 [Cochliomyia hominivorax]